MRLWALPMGDRVSFSDQALDLGQIAKHHADCETALREYFSTASPSFIDRYAGRTLLALKTDLAFNVEELDYNSAFDVMAAIEAALRTDYLTRVYERKKGRLSRAFRAINKAKGAKASLEKDILAAWRQYAALPNGVYSALLKAFEYRHWLAHGRYWTPTFHRQYDFFTVFGIAQELFEFMDVVAAARNV